MMETGPAPAGKWMDPMHEQEAIAPNAKVMLLAVGGAALAALLIALSRRDHGEEPAARAEAAAEDLKKTAKKAAKEAKKQQKEAAEAAAAAGDRSAEAMRAAAAKVERDAKDAERDLKAAAWDAQQRAQEAESRLRAAGQRVVDDAAHLASRVGTEARTLAGEGKDKITHLRQKEEPASAYERELRRMREEIDDLRGQLARAGVRVERGPVGRSFRLARKDASVKEAMASEAAAAALAQVERSLRAKAPQLLAARNRHQALEILQQDLGPTLRDTAMQAATAALGIWEAARDRAQDVAADVKETARDVGEDVREGTEDFAADARTAARDAREDGAHARAAGKRRFWRAAGEAEETADEARARFEAATERLAEKANGEEEGHGKAGLFWGGAGLGLALYALLDPERREKLLHFANEASTQMQELVRDMQGYDDEF
jgi:hypothetical protein